MVKQGDIDNIFEYCIDEFKELHSILFLDAEDMRDMCKNFVLFTKKGASYNQIKQFLKQLIINMDDMDDREYLLDLLTSNNIHKSFFVFNMLDMEWNN